MNHKVPERKNEYDRKNSQEQKVVEGEEGGVCRGGYQTNGKAEMLDSVGEFHK